MKDEAAIDKAIRIAFLQEGETDPVSVLKKVVESPALAGNIFHNGLVKPHVQAMYGGNDVVKHAVFKRVESEIKKRELRAASSELKKSNKRAAEFEADAINSKKAASAMEQQLVATMDELTSAQASATSSQQPNNQNMRAAGRPIKHE